MRYEERAAERAAALRERENFPLLAIESSCDETSAAVLCGREVKSLVISSQIDIHRRFGGVVPEIASRNHTLAVNSVAEEALNRAGMGFSDLDAVAVTYGAGLAGALLVGVSYAKAIAYALGLPLVKVNHIKGHIAANYLADPELEPPFLCLVVSGGHTAIVEVISYTEQRLIGTTVDDAAGEAFDKVARVLGLPYPGGPEVDRLAKAGRSVIELPRMFKNERNYNFSSSGLQTAVVNYVQTARQRGEEISREDLCASFESAALDILIEKTLRAAREFGYRTVALAGGVSANSYLREHLCARGEALGLKICMPPLLYCTDNAAMIGVEGYYSLRAGKNLAGLDLNSCPALRF